MIWLVIMLFLSGVIFITAEFFVPGGILGVIGVLLVVGSCATGWTNYPDYGFFIVVGELLGVAASVLLGMYLLSHTGAGKFMVLKNAQEVSEGWSTPAYDSNLVGKKGLVLTALRPAGTIEISDSRIDAVSDGEFIEEGKRIRVTEVEGHRVVVEESDSAHSDAEPEPTS